MRKIYFIPITLLTIGFTFIVIFFIKGLYFASLDLVWSGLIFIFIGSIVEVALLIKHYIFDRIQSSRAIDKKMRKIFPKAFYEKLAHRIFPRYNEIVLFALALTVLFLFFMDFDFSQKMIRVFSGSVRITMILVLGLLATFFHFFSKKRKSMLSKYIMGFFLFFFSCFVCYYSITFKVSYFISFISILNVVYLFLTTLCFFVLMQYDSPIFEKLIDDYEPSNLEKLFSFVIIIGIFYISYFIFKANWIVTMSFVVFYTNLLHRSFSKLLFHIKNKSIFLNAIK